MTSCIAMVVSVVLVLWSQSVAVMADPVRLGSKYSNWVVFIPVFTVHELEVSEFAIYPIFNVDLI